jgi:hypothetical protein
MNSGYYFSYADTVKNTKSYLSDEYLPSVGKKIAFISK